MDIERGVSASISYRKFGSIVWIQGHDLRVVKGSISSGNLYMDTLGRICNIEGFTGVDPTFSSFIKQWMSFRKILNPKNASPCSCAILHYDHMVELIGAILGVINLS